MGQKDKKPPGPKKWVGQLQMIRNVSKAISSEAEGDDDEDIKLIRECAQMVEGIVESYEEEMSNIRKRGKNK